MDKIPWMGLATGVFLVAIVARLMKDPKGAASLLSTGINGITKETQTLISG